MEISKKTLKWLHISDVHFSGQNSYDQNRLVSALLRSLPNLMLRFGRPDFVFFTGDLAKSGQKSEYAEATSFFEHLLSVLGLEKDRLLVIPGNHDVDRKFNAGLSRDLKSRIEIDAIFSGEPVYQIEKRQAAFKDWYESFSLHALSRCRARFF
ncbi:MAG: hypothetical protein CMN67_10410 [Sphingomonadaceae bacterium]|nr:hypothetical protein [Sphingomonadaceae bacterium]MBG75094.1 hypothetical protein [Erythrobacteraceae bacterium]